MLDFFIFYFLKFFWSEGAEGVGGRRSQEMAISTSSVYVSVIEDVINKVREEFMNNDGPGDDVLKELQGVILLKSSLYLFILCFILFLFHLYGFHLYL